jgi:hydroxymethylpyrimidine/phosphomethylpyrimidine kinase
MALGLFGTSVITCITAQNTQGVQKITPLDNDIITKQLNAVLIDIKPSAIKTGMLFSAEIIELIVEVLDEYDNTPLVVDPVMVATTGADLTHDSDQNKFISALKNSLIPKATVVTPNIHEAETLIGREIKSAEEIKKACEEIYLLGPKNVLIKGGHAKGFEIDKETEGEVVDVLFDGDFHTFKGPRFNKDVHGTGCTLSSLIAGYLAKGYEVNKGIELSKLMITAGIRDSLKVGSGVEAVNILPDIGELPTGIRGELITAVSVAADELEQILTPFFIPEVGINIGYAEPNASNFDNVCALSGRITRVGGHASYIGSPKFGASKHVARIILAAMSFHSSFRCAMNLKYRPEIVQACMDLGYSVGTFSRDSEPEDKSSMEWGTKTAIESVGTVPDIIYDTGGMGKEPMVRVLGTDPEDVLGKVKRIFKKFE